MSIRKGNSVIAGVLNPEAGFNLVTTTALSSGTSSGTYITFKDSTNTKIGHIETRVCDGSVAGKSTTKIWAQSYKSSDQSNVISEVSMVALSDGTAYATAPTPSSTTDDSNKIATTKHLINVLKAIYPVGSVYIGTQSTCPMSSFFGTWELVSSGKALWTGTGSNGNTTIAAGLPNITGALTGKHVRSYVSGGYTSNSALYRSADASSYTGGYGPETNAGSAEYFDASRCNSIYGNSTTVQPPAYVVNVWRRTA